MVLKGVKARKLKQAKLVGRPERSLFVSFKNKVERPRVVEILEKSHPEVERVFLPRQKLPKFVYVLCKSTEERESVRECLKKLKNEELGRLRVVNPKLPKPKLSEEEETAKNKPKIDTRCLLLEFIPKEVTTELLENSFPEAETINRFNKRRCYIHFKNAKDAMKARIRMATEEFAGHKLKVKFNKVESPSSDTTD